MAAIGGSMGIAVIAFMLRWALKELRKLPTVRMLLMLITGVGLSYALGSIILGIYGWIAAASGGALPGPIAGAIVALPIGGALVALVFFLVHLHPREKPDERTEKFALALPVLLLFIGGTLGAYTGDLRSNLQDTTSEMLTRFTPNQHAQGK
jgi:MFS family permease